MLEGSFTSQPSARTSTPSLRNSSAACRQRSFLRAQRTRSAPISARPSAICLPRPTEPPVTMATRPLRSKICFACILPLVQQPARQACHAALELYHSRFFTGPTCLFDLVLYHIGIQQVYPWHIAIG